MPSGHPGEKDGFVSYVVRIPRAWYAEITRQARTQRVTLSVIGREALAKGLGLKVRPKRPLAGLEAPDADELGPESEE